MDKFNKRIYDCRSFINDLKALIKNIPFLIFMYLNRRISKSFASKIMLTVTTVNDCRYCTWFHTKVLLSEGVAPEEIRRIQKFQLYEEIDEYEIIAVAYAQHYSETARNPAPEATKKLYAYYGEEKANHIMLYIEFVYFANIVGNTFDAFISRFKGQKAPNSGLCCELMLFMLSAPILLPLKIVLDEKK
jgi:AhpD family alkylhydroperoxidase